MSILNPWNIQSFNEKKNLCLIVLLTLLLTSCGFSPSEPGPGPGPGPSPSYPNKEDVNEFINNLSNDAGSVDDYVLRKYKTEQGGGYIILEDDFGDVRGIDIYLGSRYDDYSSDLEFFDAHSFPVDPADDIGTNYYRDYDGNLYEETTITKKDLEHMGAILEKIKRGKIQKYVVNQFQLSEQRAETLSKMIFSWKKIDNKRGVTQEDIKIFSSKLLGFDYLEGIKAYISYIEGDETDFNLLMEKAADVNQTDPEHMKLLLQMFLK